MHNEKVVNDMPLADLSAANNAKIASELGAAMVIVKNDNFADERRSTNSMRIAEEYSGDHRSMSPEQMQQDAGEDKTSTNQANSYRRQLMMTMIVVAAESLLRSCFCLSIRDSITSCR